MQQSFGGLMRGIAQRGRVDMAETLEPVPFEHKSLERCAVGVYA